MSRTKFPETRRIVLTVNDQSDIDSDLYAWLQSRGVAVLRANSTVRALELMDLARADVVISDLARNEDGGENPSAGMHLAKQIRKRGSQVPIVIYTMNKAPQVKGLAVDAGANYVTESAVELRSWLENMGI